MLFMNNLLMGTYNDRRLLGSFKLDFLAGNLFGSSDHGTSAMSSS